MVASAIPMEASNGGKGSLHSTDGWDGLAESKKIEQPAVILESSDSIGTQESPYQVEAERRQSEWTGHW